MSSGTASQSQKAATVKDVSSMGGAIVKLQGGGLGLLTGCRIPKSYFVTTGFGETDSGGGIDPWETGAYDIALETAGIQDYNVMQYTSVMPPESHEVTLDEARPNFQHGAVLDVIMARMDGAQGDRLSAGVGRAQVRKKKDGSFIGGYAAEYRGHAKESDVEDTLRRDLTEIFNRRYNGDEYELVNEQFTVIEREVQKGYGTVLASICFTSYIHPIITIPGNIDDTSVGEAARG